MGSQIARAMSDTVKALETSCERIASAYAATEEYAAKIKECMDSGKALSATESGLPDEAIQKTVGKVRDIYVSADTVALVATDRQSAFDRHLASVPFKGQVLSRVSQWWFKQTEHIVPNHVTAVPHANITVGRKCEIFPIEFVVRAYMTGSTDTAMWTHYSKGVRDYCGHSLPEGLIKNQKLEHTILTPTTKSTEHDECISPAEIVKQDMMSQADFDFCKEKALEVFAFASEKAAARGLILVDTKFEFGKVGDHIVLADEILTPDSSRYWIGESYAAHFAEGKNPENIDKEFLRLWYREHCDPYKDEILPEAPAALVIELSRRYIMLFEVMTDQKFEFQDTSQECMSLQIRKVFGKADPAPPAKGSGGCCVLC